MALTRPFGISSTQSPNWHAVTQSDTDDLPRVGFALKSTADCTLKVTNIDGTTVVLHLKGYQIEPCQVTRVWSTGGDGSVANLRVGYMTDTDAG